LRKLPDTASSYRPRAVRARNSSGATVAKTTGWVVIGALAGLGALILIAAAVFSGD
jgi:hypothetical protein